MIITIKTSQSKNQINIQEILKTWISKRSMEVNFIDFKDVNQQSNG